MELRTIHDRSLLAECLMVDPGLHLYALGDLDENYWPFTLWFGSFVGERPQVISFLYTGSELPIYQALCEDAGRPAMAEHVSEVSRLLPRAFYAHLSPGLEAALEPAWELTSHGEHSKWLLTSREYAQRHSADGVVPLTPADAPALRRLYQASYPQNSFEPRTLESGCYFGIWEEGTLISAAGVHVLAPGLGVAALGNVATHPTHRGRGHATRVTARLCQKLIPDFPYIGLNVKSDNRAARVCYRRLGFEEVATYFEMTCRLHG